MDRFFTFAKETVLDALKGSIAENAQAACEEAAHADAIRAWQDDLKARTDGITAERLEGFLEKHGSVSEFFGSDSGALPEDQLKQACDDFFTENPEFVPRRAEIEVVLRHAMQQAHCCIMQRISPGERLLFQQGETLRTQMRQLEQFLRDSQQKGLGQVKLRQIFDTIRAQLDNGLLREGLQLIELLETSSDGAPAAAALRARYACWKENSIHDNGAFARACELADADWLREKLCDLAAMANDNGALELAAREIQDPDQRTLLLQAAASPAVDDLVNSFCIEGVLKKTAAASPAILWLFSERLNQSNVSFQERLKALEPGLVTGQRMTAARIEALTTQYGQAVQRGEPRERLHRMLHELFDFYGQMEQLHAAHRHTALFRCTQWMYYADWSVFSSLRASLPEAEQSSDAVVLAELRHRVFWEHDIPAKTIESVFIPGCDREIAEVCARMLLKKGAYEELIGRVEADRNLLEQPTDLLSLYVQALLLAQVPVDKELLTPYEKYYRDTPTIPVLTALMDVTREGTLSAERLEAFTALARDARVWRTQDIFLYIDLCKRLREYDAALALLDRYAPLDVDFRHSQIRFLYYSENNPTQCAEWIRALDRDGAALPEEYYWLGMLQEKICSGSGKMWFEKAYRLEPRPQYADALCTARLLGAEAVEDAALQTLARTEQPRAQHLAALTYFRLGQSESGEVHLMRALLLCESEYDEDIYHAYISRRFFNSEKTDDEEVNSIQGDCIVTLRGEDGAQLCLALHQNPNCLPQKRGISFAGCRHFWLNAPEVSDLVYAQNGDRVRFEEEDYAVESIGRLDQALIDHCLRALVEHGLVWQISFQNAADGLERMRGIMQQGASDRETIFKQLQEGKFTVYGTASAAGKSFFVTQLALFQSGELCAGPDGTGQELTDARYLLTNGAAVLLSLMDLPHEALAGLSMMAAGKRLLREEAATEEDSVQRSSGTLFLTESSEMGMIKNTVDARREAHRNRTKLQTFLEALDDAEETPEIDLIPEAHETVSDLTGLSDWQAIASARAYDYVLVSDDWMLTQIAHLVGVRCVNSAGLLRALPLDIQQRTTLICELLRHGYRTPVSFALLSDLNEALKRLPLGDEKERLAESVIELFHLCLGSPLHRDDFRMAMRDLPQRELAPEFMHYLACICVREGIVSRDMLKDAAAKALSKMDQY